MKPLTPREKEIVNLISEGLTAKNIGDKLGIAKRTAEQHTANCLTKTGAKNKAHLVRIIWDRSVNKEINHLLKSAIGKK